MHNNSVFYLAMKGVLFGSVHILVQITCFVSSVCVIVVVTISTLLPDRRYLMFLQNHELHF